MDNDFSYDGVKAFSVEYISEEGFVALTPEGKKLFTIFPFDNGPDYPSEGFIRITEDGKIGFANLCGEIIIHPKLNAALPFSGDLAAFCENCSIDQDGEHSFWKGGMWGFINTSGDIIIPPTYDKIIESFSHGYATVEINGSLFNIDTKGEKLESEPINYKEWTRLLGNCTELIGNTFFENNFTISLHNNASLDNYLFTNKSSGVIQIDVDTRENHTPIITYVIIPWQNFVLRQSNLLSISPLELYDILTVTEFGIIYSSGILVKEDDINYSCACDFDKTFKKMVDYDSNENPEEPEHLKLPEGIQIIKYEVRPNYITLQVAQPGSKIPDQSEWGKVSEDRMLYLQIIPDIGNISRSWFKPTAPYYDTYYTAVENDLLNLFDSAIHNAFVSSSERKEIFNKAREEMRGFFNAANSYVNFLYDFYEAKLRQWLLLGDEETIAYPSIENIFGDYQPKRTPDTVIDYMPQIHDEFVNLPEPKAENLEKLIVLFGNYKASAEKNPGEWIDGNMILGARQREYLPSKDELILAETGKLIKYVLESCTDDVLKLSLQRITNKPNTISYREFTFIHYDVMGSGRFFYVDSITEIEVEL